MTFCGNSPMRLRLATLRNWRGGRKRSVTQVQMGRLWDSIRDRTTDPQAGIFGPFSISWRIHRESALFLGAGRAALLQLAHPWVAAAIDRHSKVRNQPIARFHNTFRVVF